MMILDDDGWWYSIQGVNPEPWESPEGSVVRKNGFHVHMRSPKRLKVYQEAVKEEFVKQNPNYVNLRNTPLSIQFHLWRNVPVFETPDGKIAYGNYADATNCQKALEDALQGILYTNDTTNFEVSTSLEQDPNIESFILIRVCLEPSADVKVAQAIRPTLYDPTFNRIDPANRLGDDRDIF